MRWNTFGCLYSFGTGPPLLNGSWNEKKIQKMFSVCLFVIHIKLIRFEKNLLKKWNYFFAWCVFVATLAFTLFPSCSVDGVVLFAATAAVICVETIVGHLVTCWTACCWFWYNEIHFGFTRYYKIHNYSLNVGALMNFTPNALLLLYPKFWRKNWLLWHFSLFSWNIFVNFL